jgi:Family of unknown function (DUF6536)
MLATPSSTTHSRGADDWNVKTISSVKYRTESYQSTARILVWTLCAMSGLMVIVTCATIGSSITSTHSNPFGISGIMPSTTLASGACDSLKYPNLILHLFVNCIGTVIIAASNYLQQSSSLKVILIAVCTSPTFEDIKKEMKEYGDVPFGANSPTALFRRRQWGIVGIWATFVLTSLPVHLFLNGVTGFSIQALPVNGRVTANSNDTFPYELAWQPGEIEIIRCSEYLANAENWVSEFKNLTIVVKLPTLVSKYQKFIDSWNTGVQEDQGPPTANEITTCYVDLQTPKCNVTLRWFPLVMTSIALVIKSVTAFIAIRTASHFKYRLYNSLGDFIAVATRHREELSVPGECLANSGEYRKGQLRALPGGTGGIPLRAKHKYRFWIRYLGLLDWTVWVFWVASMSLTWFLMNQSLNKVRNVFKDESGAEITNLFQLFSLSGFGKASLAFLISNARGQAAFAGQTAAALPIQIALANAPQLWLSLTYLLWNNQITRIWSEHEWRSYDGRRKRPRVSYGATEPGVRTTRWLQLPYMLSVLLMAISITMHWVVSQALFVVEVENFSHLPRIGDQSAPFRIIFAICYSPSAIFVIAMMSLILILGITIYYVLPFRSWMPFMAGSARVVFASCTALPKDLPADGIMWGDVSDEWGRLAGFGENAKALQVNQIYPERSKRPDPSVAVPPTDRAVTARTISTVNSLNRDSIYDRSVLSVNTGNIHQPASERIVSPSPRSAADTIYTILPPYESSTLPRYQPETVERPAPVREASRSVSPTPITLRYPTEILLESPPPQAASPTLTTLQYPPEVLSRTTSPALANASYNRQTRQSLGYGTGYGTGFRNRFSLHGRSTDDLLQTSQTTDVVEDSPVVERGRSGWGDEDEDEDTYHSPVAEVEWRGWGN